MTDHELIDRIDAARTAVEKQMNDEAERFGNDTPSQRWGELAGVKGLLDRAKWLAITIEASDAGR